MNKYQLLRSVDELEKQNLQKQIKQSKREMMVDSHCKGPNKLKNTPGL